MGEGTSMEEPMMINFLTETQVSHEIQVGLACLRRWRDKPQRTDKSIEKKPPRGKALQRL
jgi:hypothetical protein